MSKRIYSILAAAAALVLSQSVFAQNGEFSSFSPYSVFGVGDLASPGSTYNKGMGGVGIASRDNRYLNTLNPAAVTARDSLAFMLEFFINNDNVLREQSSGSGTLRGVNNSTNIGGFAASVPIWRSSALMVGLAPYSGTGYTFNYKETNPSVIATDGNIDNSIIGQGSLYRIFLGGGVSFKKRISIGAELDYIFGNSTKGFYQDFLKTPHNETQDIYTLSLHSISAKFGFQYEQPLGEKMKLGLGGTWSLPSMLRGTIDYARNAVGSAETVTVEGWSDTLAKRSEKIILPSEFGIGISFRYADKFRAEIDWTRADWTKSGLDAVSGFGNEPGSSDNHFSTRARNVFRAGIEFVPNRSDIRYYYKRIAYRAGAYRINDYYAFDGRSVASTGITLGATLPVFRWYNGFSFSVDLGQRGALDGSLVRERYIKFSFGVNLFDIWFQKPRYD